VPTTADYLPVKVSFSLRLDAHDNVTAAQLENDAAFIASQRAAAAQILGFNASEAHRIQVAVVPVTSVKVQQTIANVNYASLTVAQRRHLKGEVAQIICSRAGAEARYCVVVLTSGSVIAETKVTPPGSFDDTSLASTLGGTTVVDAINAEVVSKVLTIPGINDSVTGNVIANSSQPTVVQEMVVTYAVEIQKEEQSLVNTSMATYNSTSLAAVFSAALANATNASGTNYGFVLGDASNVIDNILPSIPGTGLTFTPTRAPTFVPTVPAEPPAAQPTSAPPSPPAAGGVADGAVHGQCLATGVVAVVMTAHAYAF